MKYSAILIGLGKIGFQYDRNIDDPKIVLSHAKAISLNPNFDLIGGVDPSEENRINFQERYGVNGFKSIEDFPPIENLSLVVIATPTVNHLDTLRMVMKLNPKVILIEKPIAQNLNLAQASLDLIAKSNASVLCNYQRNVSDVFLDLAQKIDNDKLCGPFTVTAWFYGSFLNIGSHFISLFLLLFPENDHGTYSGDFRGNILTLQNNSVTIYLIQIPESAASVFEFSIFSKSVKIEYNSAISEIKYNYLIESNNYSDERFFGNNVEIQSTNENQLLEKVYAEIVKLLDGDPFSLCDIKLAFRAQELLNFAIKKK